jgi:hypothetical protein
MSSFEQILSDLINKNSVSNLLNTENYECKYLTQISFGRYKFCGNTQSYGGSGFTLTESKENSIYGDPHNFMIKLELLPNFKLLNDAEFFDIYTNTEFLFGYNVGSIIHNLKIFKNIEPELIGTELEIVFSKKKILTKEEQDIVNKRLFRTPREEIFRIKVKIPEINHFGDKSDCNICLDSVTENNNKYISYCGHLFHMDCIIKYLESKNLLNQIHNKCTIRCCGARKPKEFECPVCKNIIN